MPVHSATPLRRLAVAAAAALTATAAPAAAHASTSGWIVTRHSSDGSERVLVAPDGYAEFQQDARGKLVAGYQIDYRSRTVILLDPAHRRYERLSLSAAVERVRTERAALNKVRLPDIDELKIGGARAQERLESTRRRARLRGLAVRAWTVRAGRSGTLRVWYARDLPAPPPDVRRLLARMAARGGAPVSGRVAVRVQQRSGRRWRTLADARRVSHGPIARSLFTRPPHGYAKGSLARAADRRPASVPATVTNHRALTLPDIQAHQAVFAVYWGARFASEPRTVSRLNSALSSVILRSPFVDGMAQYGVRPGRFLGSAVVANDPPPSIGNADFDGWLVSSAATLQFRFLPGAPDRWWRVGDQDPLIVLFVPEDRVVAGNAVGYHSVTPIETAWIDPLGLLLVPVMPFAVVKVPRMTPGDGYLDQATVTLSHETAEAATDPLSLGWFQDNPPSGEQGEVSDICHEGPVAPFGDKSRVAGVAVATYWSNQARACVPDPRPSIRITAPGDTAAWAAPIPVAAEASSPFDGSLPAGRIAWSLDGAPVALDAHGAIPGPSPGAHALRATVTDSQGMTASASTTVTVVADPPDVTVSAPLANAHIPTDAIATLRGSAADARGAIRGDRLAWSVQRAGEPAAVTVGHGETASYRFPIEGEWTVTLTATSASGRSAARSVHVTVIPPPPRFISIAPADGSTFADGYRNPIRFSVQAVDGEGKRIGDDHIGWSDDVDGSLGKGATLMATLSGSATELVEHHVTVIATAPDGQTVTKTITVWSGEKG
jgi:hypothetical protein